MSLMKTLARVAVGVAVAKGVGHMMNRRSDKSGGASGGGLGGLLGGLAGSLGGGQGAGRGASGGAGGGLQDMMGSILGGGAAGGRSGGGLQGGLGGLLESLGGGRGGSGGGLGGLLGGLAGAGAAGGGLGGLLGSLSGSAQRASEGREGANNASFGEVLNSSFPQNDAAEIPPTPEQEALAALMLRAMIQAAKSDGVLDEGEKSKLLGQMGDVSDDEMAFVQDELKKPVDAAGLARDVPDGMEEQVYAMSIMAIDLDHQDEAQYLHDFATALKLDKAKVNEIHAELGVPALYS